METWEHALLTWSESRRTGQPSDSGKGLLRYTTNAVPVDINNLLATLAALGAEGWQVASSHAATLASPSGSSWVVVTTYVLKRRAQP